jgi:hypothetical protein
MLNCRPLGEIEKRVRQIENETVQISQEVEQLRLVHPTLSTFNAETQDLISSIDQLCFPPDTSSILQTPTEPEGKPSSP